MKKTAIALTVLLIAVAVSLCVRLKKRERLEVIYKTPRSYRDIKPVVCQRVIPVIYKKIPCLASLKPEERKKTFVNLLLPAILVENYRLERLRKRISELKEKLEKGKLSSGEEGFLEKMCKRYRAKTLDELLYKVAPVPPGLAIAQAAIESGWGSSRFFCKANNVFGEWSFSGKGIQAKNSRAKLKVFSDLLEAVRSYFYNLNAGWAYEGFRIARSKNPSSLALAKYLEKYSILGKEYVKRVERVIKVNHLEKYDACKISDRYIHTSYSLELTCLL